MRKEWYRSGSDGSTWPTGARPARTISRRRPVDEGGGDPFARNDAPSRTTGLPAGTRVDAGDAPPQAEERVALYEIEAAGVGEVPEDEVCAFEVEGREIALCRVHEQVFALDGLCPYHPIPLAGAKLDSGVLTCPRYGVQFDVRTGESVFLRPIQPLTTYPTAVRNGHVFVRLPLEAEHPAASRWV